MARLKNFLPDIYRALAAVATLLLIAGTVIAWRANQPTFVLGAGAILMVFALVGRNIKEIRMAAKENSLAFILGEQIEADVEAVKKLAEQIGSPAEVRERIEEMLKEIEVKNERLTAQAERIEERLEAVPVAPWPGWREAKKRGLITFEETSTFAGFEGDHVSIVLNTGNHEFRVPVRCLVNGPQDRSWRVEVGRLAAQGVVILQFPQDFHSTGSSDDVVDGRYVVSWTAAGGTFDRGLFSLSPPQAASINRKKTT